MPTGLPTVYLDTNIFQPLIYNSDGHSDTAFARSQLENIRGDVREDRIDVIIPKPALGELVDNFYEDLAEYGPGEVGTWDDFAEQLAWYLEQIEATLCPLDQENIKTAAEILDKDTRFAGDDAIIAACALDDRWSNHLVTGDPDFHETNAIQEIDQDRQPTPRLNELNITDNY